MNSENKDKTLSQEFKQNFLYLNLSFGILVLYARMNSRKQDISKKKKTTQIIFLQTVLTFSNIFMYKLFPSQISLTGVFETLQLGTFAETEYL